MEAMFLYYKKIYYFLFSLILEINMIFAQGTQPLFNNLNEKFPDLDICVNDIIRDSGGYVWIAGGHSLQRFDGNVIKQYLIKNPDGYINYSRGLLFEDSKNNLWIYCNGLLLLYDPLYDDFHTLEFDLPAAYFFKKALVYKSEGVPEEWTGVEKMEMK